METNGREKVGVRLALTIELVIVMLMGIAIVDVVSALETPELNSVYFDRQWYREDDSVQLNARATEGTYAIDYYYVLCEVEGAIMIHSEIANGIRLTHTFLVNKAGILKCHVSVSDIYGNPSEMWRLEVTIWNQALSDFCYRHLADSACPDVYDSPYSPPPPPPNGDDSTGWELGDEGVTAGICVLVSMLGGLLLYMMFGSKKRKEVHCDRCGSEMTSDMKFCSECGWERCAN